MNDDDDTLAVDDRERAQREAVVLKMSAELQNSFFEVLNHVGAGRFPRTALHAAGEFWLKISVTLASTDPADVGLVLRQEDEIRKRLYRELGLADVPTGPRTH